MDLMTLALEPAVGFDLHSFAIFLHIILMTYWLGSDIGVFYASKYVVNPEISPVARGIAMKIMHMVDLAPRICLILMLPSGVTLMASTPLGEDIFYGWLLVLAWVGALAWLGIMLVSFFRNPQRYAAAALRADWIIRSCVAAGLLLAAAYAFVVVEPFGVETNPKWLAGKVAAYAMCIVCGIMIRVSLKPFGPAFGVLMTSGSTPAVEADIGGAMRRAIPWVLAIWFFVLLAAFLGVVKPGTLAG